MLVKTAQIAAIATEWIRSLHGGNVNKYGAATARLITAGHTPSFNYSYIPYGHGLHILRFSELSKGGDVKKVLLTSEVFYAKPRRASGPL